MLARPASIHPRLTPPAQLPCTRRSTHQPTSGHRPASLIFLLTTFGGHLRGIRCSAVMRGIWRATSRPFRLIGKRNSRPDSDVLICYVHTLTNMLTYLYLHTYILTVLTYLHTYILTYLHTYILTYLHTYIQQQTLTYSTIDNCVISEHVCQRLSSTRYEGGAVQANKWPLELALDSTASRLAICPGFAQI